MKCDNSQQRTTRLTTTTSTTANSQHHHHHHYHHHHHQAPTKNRTEIERKKNIHFGDNFKQLFGQSLMPGIYQYSNSVLCPLPLTLTLKILPKTKTNKKKNVLKIKFLLCARCTYFVW